MSLICICALLVCLSTSIASDELPIIHTIPLQTETVVPEEYRSLPLVGKCCPVNEVFVRSVLTDEPICVSSTDSTMLYFSPFFSVFNRTGVFVPGDEFPEFVAIVGSPCNEKYMLQPETDSNDIYFLLLNGSIFMPKIDNVSIMLMPGKDYCMEIVPGLGLLTFVCFLKESPSIVHGSDKSPIIHTIPLQTETVVPEEYRSLPLVGKCCPVNEVLVRSAHKLTKCVPLTDSSVIYFSPFFNAFNRTGVLVPGDEFSEFVAIVGSPCDKTDNRLHLYDDYFFMYNSFLMDYENLSLETSHIISWFSEPQEHSDSHYLLLNGSIYTPKISHERIMLMPGKDYCIEVVPGLGRKTFVCFPEGMSLNKMRDITETENFLYLFVQHINLQQYCSNVAILHIAMQYYRNSIEMNLKYYCNITATF